MSSNVHPVQPAWRDGAKIDAAGYERMYADSVRDPEAFWAEHGKRIDWMKPYSQIKDVSYDASDLHIRWFHDGTLNVAANCIDRHLETRGDKTAIIWEGDEPTDDARITYRELFDQVSRLGSAMRDMGVAKGDVVTIYMPMIPEAAVAMLACARIGAVHSIVFGGFSPEALAGRIEDCGSKWVITSDEGLRGGKSVPLKNNVDKALGQLDGASVQKVVVVFNHIKLFNYLTQVKS